MGRLAFLILLVAVLATSAHIALSMQAEKSDFTLREKNRDEIKLVAVTPPTVAAKRAQENRTAIQALVGAACVEFSGVVPGEAQKARDAFAAMQLGERLTERKIEEVSRYWVYVALRDRKAAETAMGELKKKGVSDVSLRPDNTISLGVFSTEDAARRYLAQVEAKGVRGAEFGPFAKELRELVLLVKEPDSELLQRLTLLQRDFANTQLRAVGCPS